jgi:very-short-patch-repair endonuclease
VEEPVLVPAGPLSPVGGTYIDRSCFLADAFIQDCLVMISLIHTSKNTTFSGKKSTDLRGFSHGSSNLDFQLSGMENSANEPFNRYGYQWADPQYYSALNEYAKKMREVPTHAESMMWNELRAKKLGGHKFRRQHLIGRYIADFTCLKKRLIIEIDGLIHQLPENIESDEIRTFNLSKMGFTIIRFTNEEVLNNISFVLRKILSILATLPGIDESEHFSL